MRSLYGITITLSAFLLFSVEPMATRALLPQLGGSSAVWISALAFFQVLLLLGYAYTVLVTAGARGRVAQSAVHIAVLAFATLSLFLPVTRAATSSKSPQLQLFVLLAGLVGLPFFALSTTTPLLQVWYARREGTAFPYRFFALSNLASLAALLLYPTVMEPHLPLSTQMRLWKIAFLAYAIMASLLALRMRAAPRLPQQLRSPAVQTAPRGTRIFWLALPGVASMQLAAVTGHLTQDVASMPLLWVVPLAAYLLSFVLAFEYPGLYRRKIVLGVLAVLLFALGHFLTLTTVNVPIGISIVLFTAELFFASWFCHAELYALRPQQTSAGSSFYFHLAAGGAIGTFAVAVLFPLLTDSNFDLAIAFLFTALLLLFLTWHQGWQTRLLWGAGAVAGVYLLFVLHTAFEQDTLLRGRNFYGSIRVKQSQAPPQAYLSRTLYNGAIQHGMQWFSTEFHHSPLTYYTPDSGVGLALRFAEPPTHPRHIGVVGLGAGTLAAYGHSGDRLRFYEINPLVTDVAQNLFTYTRDTPAAVTVVPGDARLSMAAEPPQNFDVLVVDAFSGDSIPTHLLTREALALYRRHLAPGGVLAFHISNQYLDLAPVLARLVESTQAGPDQPMVAREFESGPDNDQGEALSYWVLATTRAGIFTLPDLLKAAKPIHTQPNVGLWTDQYSSLLPILRWTGRHD